MRVALLLAVVCLGIVEGESPANWTANYSSCDRHDELLSRAHMELGVKLATGNLVLAREFRRAMDAWASIVDLGWHEDDTNNCAIQIVDGERQLFQSSAISARAQLPDLLNFQGWIAFNAGQKLSEMDLYQISLHEIGHMLGLKHSAHVDSVMYSFNLDDQGWLEPEDLADLAKHHKLRVSALDRPIRLAIPAHNANISLASSGQ